MKVTITYRPHASARFRPTERYEGSLHEVAESVGFRVRKTVERIASDEYGFALRVIVDGHTVHDSRTPITLAATDYDTGAAILAKAKAVNA